MVMLLLLLAASVTVMVSVPLLPAVVGVPEIIPVEEFIVIPLGRLVALYL